jgi:low affinity Fe/Cu permease
MHETFRSISTIAARTIGSIWAFITLIAVIGGTGYYYGFSDGWKNNVMFIVAVISLAVLILLQASQNHNDTATHIKLDELISAVEGARDEVASVEEQSEKEMRELKKTNPSETITQ